MSETLLEVDALDAFYGDFQALFGVSMRVEAGAIVAVIGANGAGKSTLLKSIAGLMEARPAAIRFERCRDRRRAGLPDRGARHCAGARRPAVVCLALGRGELADRRPARPARPVESRERLRAVPGAGGAARPALDRTVRRPAADGRHRPRPDVEPEAHPVRRDQPRPRTHRGARHLCAAAVDRAARDRRSSSSSRTSCRRSPPATTSTACRRAASRSPAPPAR